MNRLPKVPTMEYSERYAKQLDEDCKRVIAIVLSAMESKRPFSMIRLGDGEGTLLSKEEDGEGDALGHILSMWFGRNAPSGKLIDDIRRGLIEAIDSADCIGVFQPGSMPDRFVRPYHFLRSRNALRDRLIVSANVHLEIHQRSLYSKLLEGQRRIGVVTCRNVIYSMVETFGVGEINWVAIPEEAKYADNDSVSSPHYPDRAQEIFETLQPTFEGELWLVGAGVLGKMYCSLLKKRGAVAVDIGSVFDSWAAHVRRGSVRKFRVGM